MKKIGKLFLSLGILFLLLATGCSNPSGSGTSGGGQITGGGDSGGTATPVNTTIYTVAFETNGGSLLESQSVASGSCAARPADPTKSGYVFWNWYSDSTCETLFDFKTPITANIKLYAKWVYGRIVTPQDAVLLDLSTEYGELALKAVGDFSSVFSTFCAAIKSYGYGINLDLSEVTGIRKIPDGAFKDVSCLKSIILPNDIVAIGHSAFENCKKLESVSLPNAITDIGAAAFMGCRCLASITIPSGVTTIRENVFSGCGSLESIVIPSGVDYIGDSAFSSSGLASITIPDSVTYIGYSAFEYCSGLESITIPSGVTLKRDAFALHRDKITVNYTGTLEEFCADGLAFGYGNGLTGSSYKYYRIHYDLYIDGIKITNLVIPNGVTSIAANAFKACDSLTSVMMSDSVTSIDDGAFLECENLTKVTIGNGVKRIGSEAFRDCKNLVTATIGSSVETIDGYAFAYGKIFSVTIPASVTFIGHGAFYNAAYRDMELEEFSHAFSMTFEDTNNWYLDGEVDILSDEDLAYVYIDLWTAGSYSRSYSLTKKTN